MAFVAVCKDDKVVGIFSTDLYCGTNPPCGGCDLCCIRQAEYYAMETKTFPTLAEAEAFEAELDQLKPVDTSERLVKVTVTGTPLWEV